MPIISLQTGKVIYMSTYEWLFQLEDKDMADFYQSCVADDLGTFENNPFAQKASMGRLEVEEAPEVEEPQIEEDFE